MGERERGGEGGGRGDLEQGRGGGGRGDPGSLGLDVSGTTFVSLMMMTTYIHRTPTGRLRLFSPAFSGFFLLPEAPVCPA